MSIEKIGFGVIMFLFTAVAFSANLTVTVERLAAPGGALRVAVFASEASWNGEGEMLATKTVEVENEEEVIFFSDLAPGQYAIRVMHDKNGNGKLDTNLFGIPKEGWGFSNNPRRRGPAKWAQAAFDVGEEDQSITIQVR